ncbi:MAG: 3-isopropylmalate dehydratase small subunit [Pseudomonadota bacterium]
MERLTKISGVAAPMPLINIDTDMILPKQYLKTIKRSGLGVALFEEMRYDMDGNEVPDFVLNRPAYRNAKILIAGDNFGCGSSREHAPWAIKDFGIKVIVSTSFADIFFQNCFKNGILPITLPQDQVDLLMEDAERGANAIMTVDLEENLITTSDGQAIPFEVEPFKRSCLLQGLDEIGLTLEKLDHIEAFETRMAKERPWIFDTPAGD